MRLRHLTLVALALSACGPAGQVQALPNPPVQTAAPNAPDQKPAFPQQTRAPEEKLGVAYQVETLATGLNHPWSLAFLPDGSKLVTERAGALRILGADGKLSPAVAGLPAVYAEGQGGLLDVALDPDYARNGLIYWTYAEARKGGGNGTTAARGKLVPGAAPSLENVQVIWRQAPALDSSLHFGGRLAFARDGALFVTTGERSILPGRMQAQHLDAALGKVIRIRPDGSIPADNPYVGNPQAKPEIWSMGHRNVQGATINPWTGQLWTAEHGAKGGDEINTPKAGKDYGWPTITYGEDYSGKPIGDGITQKAGMEQPVYYWDPVIAPSGLAFYDAGLFPAWKGSLFVGGLKGYLVRLTLKDDKVVGEERLLSELNFRIRDVRVGPDGAVYVVTDEDDGRVLRLSPKG
ncbi:glucose dehydrogenase [Caulobacter sp. Root655]|uniref:PQQ-dependent sugar dehydrogenase n=1 Tax=Caulobacter sp. Root655 TaxID=1736578 RepID=UPI0006F2147D|nr:PQQ-dependent sugar dehydrogenase [Caulobacter sp. Root655]KRA61994.1 glucose dehydrogenase [Caulobacter sp. Root655]